MNTNASFFVYTRPKSNLHGHYVKDKNLSRGLTKVINAFEKGFEGYQSGNIQVEIFYNKEYEKELELAQQTVSKLNTFLGLPIHKWENSGDEYFKSSIRWESASKNILDILEFINIHQNKVLPVLHFTIIQFYHYGTTITENAQITYIIDYGKLFVSLYMILPYSADEEKVFRLIAYLYKVLPFKLDPKNFRRLGPKNNRRGLWKLDPDTQQLLESYLVEIDDEI